MIFSHQAKQNDDDEMLAFGSPSVCIIVEGSMRARHSQS